MSSIPPPPPPSSGPDRPPAAFPPPTTAPGVPAPTTGIPAATSGPAAAQRATPPRPQVRGAALLVVAGALVAGIGVYLPWMTAEGETFDGTDAFVTGDSLADLEIIDGPGTAMLLVGAALLGLGIALYAAGRVLALAIVTIVIASIALLLGFGMLAVVDDSRGFFRDGDAGFGVGVILQPIGPGIALGGSIWATARRRR